jgi:hypothetical protein
VSAVTCMLRCVTLSCSYRPLEGLFSLRIVNNRLSVNRALNLTTSQKHTNSRQQIASGDTKNQSATQEITRLVRNTGVHRRAHNSPHKILYNVQNTRYSSPPSLAL